jgi:hypothetical protein
LGRGNLSHIDKGVLYVPVNGSETVQEVIDKYNTDKTIVIFRSGKGNMKYILQELIRTRLNT